MNWLHYLAEANLYLAVFYLAYCLLLSRETHYQLNRTYLLFSCVAAFALPVLQIGTLKTKVQAIEKPVVYAMPAQAVQETPMQMQLQTVNDYQTSAYAAQPKAPAITAAAPVVKPQLSLFDYLWYAYLAGSAVLLVMLIVRLISLLLLTQGTVSVKHGRYKIVQLPGTNIAFSFFNYLFLGDNAPATNTIITHELVHIRQKHSADVIFLELLKIVNWFNPFVYLLQNSLKTVHEYIADEHTASHENDAYTYASFLVSTAHGVGGSPITHSFFNYNLLKKRITMLNQKRSGNSARLKYLVTAPICAALLCVSTLAFTKSYNFIDLDPVKAVKAFTNKIVHPKPAAQFQQNAGNVIQPVKIETTLPDSNNAAPTFKVITQPAANITNKDKPLPPFVYDGGYTVLAHYLRKNIIYKPAADDKGGMVVVGITLDKDLKVTEPKIEISAGDKLDKLALDAFKNYKGTVNDDAGKYLKIAVYFFTDNYDIFNYKFPNMADPAGAVAITDSPYKAKLTLTGYEFDEAGGDWTWIYLKDGSALYYNKNTITDQDTKVLKDKYGYVFPSNSNGAMGWLPPVDGNKYRWVSMTVNSYLNAPYTKDFYDHVYNELQYPAQAKTDGKTAVVLAKFDLDDKGTISNVGIAKTGGEDFDNAAIDAIKSFNGTINDKAGQHTIAIVFCNAVNGTRPIVSNSFKKDGYVGELARGEEKPIKITVTKVIPVTEQK
ncbi:TonB family protein [Mucilaginibacter ximonensis]|uniref:TonB family protein n=1 Tax=Mucilaginibacter ximonensis TaxID=538021 RepID=A0ABW5Y795_9SPHI